MSYSLVDLDCNPDYSDAERMSHEEISTHLAQIPDWEHSFSDDESKIIRTFRLRNFNEAIKLANKIAAEADRQDHHPSIVLEWGRCTVTWWTHALSGLHLNDFIMAAKSDKLASQEI